MEKYGASGFPTMVAFDAEGKEIDRKVGFGSLDDHVAWFQDLPVKALPAAELLAKAKASPKDARLQLAAARKLVADGKLKDAAAYFKRAQAGEAKIAASAAWDAGRMDLAASESSARQKFAERVASKYPATDEGDMAIRYLATLEKPPVKLIEAAISKRADAFKTEASELNGLAYVALRGGALKAAQKVATLLEELSKQSPAQLDTVAEVWHMSGQHEKAIAIEQRAMGMAKGPLAAGLAENLARFEKRTTEPGADVLAVRAPSFDPQPKVAAASSARSRAPAWARGANAAKARIPEECATQATGVERLELFVLSAAPGKHQVVARPGTPAALLACVDKVVKSLDITANQTFPLDIAMDPPGFAKAVRSATQTAQSDCQPVAAAAQVEHAEGVLVGSAKGIDTAKLTVPSAGAAASPELAKCVLKPFAGLKLKRSMLIPISLDFAKKLAAQ